MKGIDPMQITGWVTGAVIAAVAGYDVVAWLAWGTDATISAFLIHWMHVYILIPFLFGMVAGHLVWQVKGFAGRVFRV